MTTKNIWRQKCNEYNVEHRFQLCNKDFKKHSHSKCFCVDFNKIPFPVVLTLWGTKALLRRCHTTPIAFILSLEFQGMISFPPLHSVEPQDWLRGECDMAMYGPSKLTGMLMGWDIECFPTFFLRMILSRNEGCMHIQNIVCSVRVQHERWQRNVT